MPKVTNMRKWNRHIGTVREYHNREIECPLCSKTVNYSTNAVSSHYRRHIKEGVATVEMRDAYLKSVGLWVNRDVEK